jgi:hypothetical protein
MAAIAAWGDLYDGRRRSSPAHRPVSIISFANKSCQPRFVPNNERFA